MRDVNETNLTDAVIAAMADTPAERTREVLGSLVRHLHAFIREVNLTEDEWLAGLQFLTATGQKCDARRQEFILLSDTLGATTMKDLVNHRKPPGLTEYTILGPFHRDDAPELALGADLAGGRPGEPVAVSGTVRGPEGEPIPQAVLDVWQSDAEGHYDLQLPDLEGPALRGIFHTDAAGRFYFRTIKPSYYPIPTDGPVGQMLTATRRQPYRPAHIHFMVSAAGYRPLTTELFDASDPYLDADPVFGVRGSLVVPFVKREAGYSLDFDFVMEKSSPRGGSPRVSRIIKAPRQAIYQAFLDPEAVATWLAPDTMRGHVHTFDPREGGQFRISLTYQNPEDSQSGKTAGDTDTYHGRFAELVPDEKIVEVIEFETQDPGFAGEMTMTVTLKDVDGGTEVSLLYENIPTGIRPEDNEAGSRQSLRKLAAFVE